MSMTLHISSVTRSRLTLCDPVDCSMPVFLVNHQLPDFSHSCPLSQWCHPTISSSVIPSPSTFNLSQHQGLFQWVSSSHQVAEVSELQLQHQHQYSGLISFRTDWFDLFAVQGTLKSLLQHHSSKASILRCLAFFIVQLSHPYMTTGKTIALTI